MISSPFQKTEDLLTISQNSTRRGRSMCTFVVSKHLMHALNLHLEALFTICKPSRSLQLLHGYRAMGKHGFHQSKGEKRQKKSKVAAHDGSENEVLFIDVKSLLSRCQKSASPGGQVSDSKQAVAKNANSPPEIFSEVEVEISEMSSTGDGLGVARTQDHVYVVPFTVPGDTVLAKIVNRFSTYTMTDFVRVIKSGPERDDSLPKCSYFAKCAGCQLQMLPYTSQLKHKKSIVEKAYQNFSTLTPETVPRVAETIGSPMQYGYRTKLTPHFDGPPGAMSRSWRRDPSKRKALAEVPAIGFQEKGRGKTIDIEDCPIGTDVVREGMKRERKRVARDFANYTKGATILLRESTIRTPKLDAAIVEDASDVTNSAAARVFEAVQAIDPELEGSSSGAGISASQSFVETKLCVTDQKAESTEYVDSYVFKNTAGSFFQNNNSILPTFTAYIRDHVIPPSPEPRPVKFLIDAYCGSGLFTITLSTLFTSSLGIDIAGASINAARRNAALNKIDNARFITADAVQLFKEVDFPASQTAVVIDPPRKGCDDAFLKQLLHFGPTRVVYVR